MEPGFHHEDVPPRQWLDELHSFDIPRAWDIELSNDQRANLAKRAQTNLNGWRTGLREQMKRIERRMGKTDPEGMEKVLAAYQKLDGLGSDLNDQVLDLANRIKAGRAIPEGFEFGTRIFGDMASKRWLFGEQDDEERWRDFLAVERRYLSINKEYKSQSRAYDNAKQRYKECQADIKTLDAEYKKRTGFMQLGLRLLIVFIAVMFALVLGGVALLIELPLDGPISSQVFGGIMLVISVVGAIIAFTLARRRRKAILQLEQDIADMHLTIENVKEEVRKQKQYLLPTRETLKEVKQDYEILKETFPI